MGDDHGLGIVGGFCLCFGLAIGLVIGLQVGSSHVKNQAIEQGYAEYDNQTGNWQWKEPVS